MLEDWVSYFHEGDLIFCGFVDDKPIFFCTVESNCDCLISSPKMKVGETGCVGTLPEKLRKARKIMGNKMIEVRNFEDKYISGCNEIWNSVVEDGLAFPQEDNLNIETGLKFYKEQSYTGVAVDTDDDEAVGLYILHPNNIGRCGHICNASFAVKKGRRGEGIGEMLVTDCLVKAKELDFKILQFNAVVASNMPAIILYRKLGFTQLGTIPKGFMLKNGNYEDIIVHYIEL